MPRAHVPSKESRREKYLPGDTFSKPEDLLLGYGERPPACVPGGGGPPP